MLNSKCSKQAAVYGKTMENIGKFIIKYFIRSRRFWILPLIVWLAVVLVSLAWNLSELKKETYNIAVEQSRALFKFIQVTRLWNAQHGGVYVPVTPRTQPNPFLNVPERDVVTTSGLKLTMINPAYMTRQISEISREQNSILFHITSLNPLRSENKPDEWEAEALKDFQSGADEKITLVEAPSGQHGGIFRYMSVLKVQAQCLKCHEKQGYKEGDIRGGIGITLPTKLLFEALSKQKQTVVLMHMAVFFLVSLLILYVLKLLRRHLIVLERTQEAQEYIIDDRTRELMEINTRLTAEINERKLTEEIIRESEMRFRSVTESAVEAIITADSSGGIVSWNKAAQSIFGYAEGEIVGGNLDILIPERYKSMHKRGIENHLVTGASTFLGRTVELYALRKNGKEFQIEISLSSWRMRQGVFFTGIVRDITERKRINEELKSKTEQLEQLNRDLERRVLLETETRRKNEQMMIQQSKMAAMGEMIGAIAHQWRQPLNTIGLLIQDIEDAFEFGELDKEYVEKTVSASMSQVKLMSKTIDDFRNFFRTSKEKEVFDVADAVNEVISILSAQLRHNYINFEIKIPQGDINVPQSDKFIFKGYHNELIQVILNIIHNAKDAVIESRQKGLLGKHEGLVLIALSRENRKIRMEVSDNGGGIPEDVIERIFEPYFTTKPVGQGTGIGLYMSKVIIENNMGGRLYAENTDTGARFTIELDNSNEGSNEAKG
jgi:PAS domain S-box-containing protein